MDAGYLVLPVDDELEISSDIVVPDDGEPFGTQEEAIEHAKMKNATAPKGSRYVPVAVEGDAVLVTEIDFSLGRDAGRADVTMRYTLRVIDDSL